MVEIIGTEEYEWMLRSDAPKDGLYICYQGPYISAAVVKDTLLVAGDFSDKVSALRFIDEQIGRVTD